MSTDNYTNLFKVCQICGSRIFNKKNLRPSRFFESGKFCSKNCLSIFRKNQQTGKIRKTKDLTSLSKPCKYCGALLYNNTNLTKRKWDNHNFCDDTCLKNYLSHTTQKSNASRKIIFIKKDYTKLTRVCKECGKVYSNILNKRPSQFHSIFCSPECRKKAAAARMRQKNPTKQKQIKQKISNTLKGISKGFPNTPEQIEKTKIRMKLNNPNQNGISSKQIFFNKVAAGYYPDISCLNTTWQEFYSQPKWKCLKCGKVFTNNLEYEDRSSKCPYCYPKTTQGKLEKEVYEFCKKICEPLNIEIIANTRKVIPPLELDMYFPSLNFAIEFDELLWHSENFADRGKTYHINKSKNCLEKGIFLFHVFDSEWISQQELIKDQIKKRLIGSSVKLNARQGEIRDVLSSEAKIFLNQNHLQGYISSSVRKGLYFNNELMALLMVSKNRFKKNTGELTRFCVKKDTSIRGGFSKLWKTFLKENTQYAEIWTYSDNRFFSGNSYFQLGFTFSHETPPNYFYTKDYKIIESRLQYQKHKLSKKLQIFDPSLTEWDNMKANGYDRIWDCGNKAFVFRRKHGN